MAFGHHGPLGGRPPLPPGGQEQPDPLPDAGRLTPGPTASITPAPSWSGIWNPSIGRGTAPLRAFTSVGLIPDTMTRTRTSPGPGSGRSISVTFSTSRAGPVAS